MAEERQPTTEKLQSNEEVFKNQQKIIKKMSNRCATEYLLEKIYIEPSSLFVNILVWFLAKTKKDKSMKKGVWVSIITSLLAAIYSKHCSDINCYTKQSILHTLNFLKECLGDLQNIFHIHIKNSIVAVARKRNDNQILSLFSMSGDVSDEEPVVEVSQRRPAHQTRSRIVEEPVAEEVSQRRPAHQTRSRIMEEPVAEEVSQRRPAHQTRSRIVEEPVAEAGGAGEAGEVEQDNQDDDSVIVVSDSDDDDEEDEVEDNTSFPLAQPDSQEFEPLRRSKRVRWTRTTLPLESDDEGDESVAKRRPML